MARRPGLPPPQLRALDRLKSVRGIDRFYLAGGAAIAVHLRSRSNGKASSEQPTVFANTPEAHALPET